MKKRFSIILSVVASILLIPLIAMQFTDEVDWNFMDFIVAGVLLFGTGLMIDFTLKTMNKSKYKFAIILVIIVILLLIWAELAVGIFGKPFGGS